ncbi:DUF742 domain-containing protein [Nocardia nova]|uniref:DUF742 domain-containing protein n=1 Tax=Nocardia nova TaxID=37330 RepID=A0A2S6AMT3_9NOCA|nr:DUF742 domain-containing protein [Nocardia nova]PPJ25817.1 DUF742 domain-containing protein [Nocardia nova]PPJ36513.1 DUF742 domain-containing protein [Nocardia nova]
MTGPRASWYEDEAGPLVRSYALTRGRTRSPRPDLDMITLVLAVDTAADLRRREPEYLDIMRLCQAPQSVAEVSATLRLPLMVTKILLSDLLADGHLICRSVSPVTDTGLHNLDLLRTVLDGIHNL